MRRVRASVSGWLLRYGAAVAADHELMWRRARREDGGYLLTPADYQLLGALDFASTLALRLGLLIMPAQPPQLAERPSRLH